MENGSMAFTVTEANALNALLRYLLNYHVHPATDMIDASAREVAVALADRAHKTLMAGLDGVDVRELWKESAPQPAKMKRDGSRGGRYVAKKGAKRS
jgi:hypothetical protein